MGKLALAAVVLVLALLAAGCDGASEPAGGEEPGPLTEPGTPPPAPEAGPPRQPARVAEVLDGDTIRLANGTRVRLVQIDAPESGGECYGAEAGDVLRGLLPAGSRIRLERDPALDDVDRYDRLLRYVHRGRTNVNLALVRRGAASVWFFDGDRGRYADRLLAAARNARAQGRGAWGACRARLDPTAAFETRPKQAAAARALVGGACHPSYAGACLDPGAADYDCAGGEGNGPAYTGRVRIVGPDVFELDGDDNDGLGCELSR